MSEQAEIEKSKPQPSLGRSIGLLGGCLVIILFLIALLSKSLLHPIRLRVVLILFGDAALPFTLWAIVRKTRLYKTKPWLYWEDQPKKVYAQWELYYALLLFPIYLAGFGWGLLLLMTASEEGSDKKIGWITEHLTAATLFVLVPQVVLAYWCISIRSPYLGLYVATSLAGSSFQLAVGGLKLENGVLGFFGKFKAQASPMTVLSCSLIFSSAFGAIHYAVWSLRPYEYVNMHGWQDSLYFSITTMATVGYGDITPAFHLARWLCTIEIISGFTLLVVAVNTSMTVWIQNHQPKGSIPTAQATENKPADKELPQPPFPSSAD